MPLFLNKVINPLDFKVNRDYVGYVPRLLIARNGNFEINTPKLALVITQYIEAYNKCHKGGLSAGHNKVN